MNVLFFESEITGHHSEYIDHMVAHLLRNPDDHTYHFVVHPDFENRFPNIVENANESKNINWHQIQREHITSLETLSIAKKSFEEYHLVENFAERLRADMVYLMHFNTFQLALALKRSRFKIRGILFNQFLRMTPKTWSERLTYYRKYWVTKLYCMNPAIDKVFVLNDLDAVLGFNKKFNTKVFSVLYDPIPNLSPLKDFDIHSTYDIRPENEIFLHFGSLASRKGTFEVLEAASLLPKAHQRKVTILLVGKPENKTTEQQISAQILSNRKRSDVQIIWENSFVSNQTMKSLFLQCSAVLMPYKNPEASSGILGHAIAAKKPVITTGKGLLKELVEENNFGILLEEVKPMTVAKAFLKIRDIRTTDLAYETYLKRHTTNEFSTQLLAQLE